MHRHLLCNRSPTRLVLVVVRTRSLTNPAPPSSHAANPKMHRSAAGEILCDPSVLIPVSPNDEIGLPASNEVSHFVPCRLHTEVAAHRIECTCRRNRHPVQRAVPDICDPHCFSREPSSISCVVTATDCSRSVVFPKILLGTCCSLVLGRSSLTSRGSLFVVNLLLLSGPSKLG